MSIVLLFSFLIGSLVAIYTFRWDPLFQLDSGPTWFVAGLILADRRLLPDSWAVRPTLGFAAGLFAVGLRRPRRERGSARTGSRSRSSSSPPSRL